MVNDMVTKLKKLILSSVLVLIPVMAFSVEVKPFTQVKSEYIGGQPISVYKISKNYNDIYVKERDDFSIFTKGKYLDLDTISGLEGGFQRLIEIYQQPSKVIIVSIDCCGFRGNRDEDTDYMIYEINNDGNLASYKKISFDEYLEINIREIDNGIKIYSKESPRTGKTYNYEYKNGKLYDYSTAMNPIVIAKENERLCKGFFNMFQTTNKEQNLTGELYSLLSGGEYSWVSHKVKTDDFLSDQLASLIKVTSVSQRKNMNYNQFKDKYCD